MTSSTCLANASGSAVTASGSARTSRMSPIIGACLAWEVRSDSGTGLPARVSAPMSDAWRSGAGPERHPLDEVARSDALWSLGKRGGDESRELGHGHHGFHGAGVPESSATSIAA